MSLGKFVLWAVVILIVCYAFHINIPGVIGAAVHALQTMHNTSASG